ncbi:unnamed protein product [Arctia plantaginis]|nr:unnamed protein product [Arctia plantaginis]
MFVKGFLLLFGCWLVVYINAKALKNSPGLSATDNTVELKEELDSISTLKTTFVEQQPPVLTTASGFSTDTLQISLDNPTIEDRDTLKVKPCAIGYHRESRFCVFNNTEF